MIISLEKNLEDIISDDNLSQFDAADEDLANSVTLNHEAFRDIEHSLEKSKVPLKDLQSIMDVSINTPELPVFDPEESLAQIDHDQVPMNDSQVPEQDLTWALT